MKPLFLELDSEPITPESVQPLCVLTRYPLEDNPSPFLFDPLPLTPDHIAQKRSRRWDTPRASGIAHL